MEKKKKILLVEDDKFIGEIYRTKLSLAGFDVVFAEDGQQAIEMVKIEKPDFILLDLLMPKMNGMEVLSVLRQTPETKDIKVMILSNSSDSEYFKDAQNFGVCGYFIKSSFSPEEIVTKINQELNL